MATPDKDGYYYTIYKVTNINSGMYYLGKHRTKNVNDGYLGSGTEIQYAVRTEGRKNFAKEILFIFDNNKDMVAKEKELVTLEIALSENTYNKSVAGGTTWYGPRGAQGPRDMSFYKEIDRPDCPTCKQRPVSVNYYNYKGIPYFRSECSYCCRKKRDAKNALKDPLRKSGYKKKLVCDRCGFKARLPEQIDVYYRDGDRQNVSPANLRSHCANCMAELKVNPGAGRNDLLADF